MDQKERQAALIQKRLADVRKALKVFSDPMNWDMGRLFPYEAVFHTTAAGKGSSENVNPLQLAREAKEHLEEVTRLLPRFLAEGEKEPVTLTAKMVGEAGFFKKGAKG